MDYLRSKSHFNSMDIWSKKYEPQTINEVVGNDEIKKVLNRFIETQQLPNILLTGSHGTSKRTLSKLFVKTYLCEDFPKGCLSIDGGIYRSKDIITCKRTTSDKSNLSTESVLGFAMRKLSLNNNRKKIVIINNFEDMTNEAQNALRRIIETCEGTTRFILISNNLDNIIEAIQSRCVSLRTNLLSYKQSSSLINELRNKNGLDNLDDDVIKIINMLSEGDLKKIINYAQTISALDIVNIDIFHRIFNIPPIKLLEQIIVDCSLPLAHYKVLNNLEFIISQGYAYSDIMDMLSKILAYENIVPDNLRYEYLKILSQYYSGMTQYTHEVHLYAMFSDFMNLKKMI